MRKFNKYKGQLLSFLLLVLLVIIYKSVDNLSAIGNFFGTIFNSIKPFVIAFLIAYIFNLPCRFFEGLLNKTKLKFLAKNSKGISILLVYIFAFFIIVISVRALVPTIYENSLDLYKNSPKYIEKMMNYINSWLERLNFNIISVESLSTGIKSYLLNVDMNEFSKYAQGVINFTSGLMNTFISIIASIYMLIDSKRIISGLKRVLAIFIEKEKSEKIFEELKKINDIFSKYIYCKLIEAVIIAFISTIVLVLFDVKYALMLGFFIGVLNIIPYFGSIISTVCVVLITLVTGGVFQAIWVLIALLILEQVDGNFIGPKILNNMLNVRPLWIIFAVTVFGKLFGIFGMLFSVPLLVIIKMVAKEYLLEKEKMIKSNREEVKN